MHKVKKPLNYADSKVTNFGKVTYIRNSYRKEIKYHILHNVNKQEKNNLLNIVGQ